MNSCRFLYLCQHREQISLIPCMSPRVYPQDGAIASQINQLGSHSSVAAASHVFLVHVVCVEGLVIVFPNT